jgi:hypothetical protein
MSVREPDRDAIEICLPVSARLVARFPRWLQGRAVAEQVRAVEKQENQTVKLREEFAAKMTPAEIRLAEAWYLAATALIKATKECRRCVDNNEGPPVAFEDWDAALAACRKLRNDEQALREFAVPMMKEVEARV